MSRVLECFHRRPSKKGTCAPNSTTQSSRFQVWQTITNSSVDFVTIVALNGQSSAGTNRFQIKKLSYGTLIYAGPIGCNLDMFESWDQSAS